MKKRYHNPRMCPKQSRQVCGHAMHMVVLHTASRSKAFQCHALKLCPQLTVLDILVV